MPAEATHQRFCLEYELFYKPLSVTYMVSLSPVIRERITDLKKYIAIDSCHPRFYVTKNMMITYTADRPI